MTPLTVGPEAPAATHITITDEALTAELADGRRISVPLVWYPRLLHATASERNNWKLHAASQHIHWEDLDEDISVEGLLSGGRRGRVRHRSSAGLRQDGREAASRSTNSGKGRGFLVAKKRAVICRIERRIEG